MKTKISLVSALMLMVCFIPLKNNGQDTLTNGEVYDFEVGDIFHTHSWAYASGGGGYTRTSNIEILEKYFSPNNNTVYYLEHFIYEEAGSSIPWHIEEGTVTISYSNLNTLLWGIDSIYSDPLFYNGRTVNYRSVYDSTYPCIETNHYVQGCGQASSSFHSWESGNDVYSFYSLFYYNKSGEEWGTPYIIVGMDEISGVEISIQIFPNPASSFVTININENNPIEEAIIYNHFGQKALVAVPVNNTVDVSKLAPGIYFLEVITSESRAGTKMVIE